jgi:glycosyltransferase involved in cell wall biosynthesis
MSNNRHAIYYENSFGRNDGSPLYFMNVLKNKLKLDVTHLAPHGETSNFGKFGFHWWIDWGEDGLPWKEWSPPKDGGKTIYVASDTHLGQDYRFKKAEEFDYVFFNQKDAFRKYNLTHENKSHWLPHAAEPQAYPNIEIIKKYDVGFVGHVQESENYNGITRIEALDRLFKEFPNFYYGSRHPAFPNKNLFEDAAKRFSESKIVFNISIKDDINMRVFETLSTGSFLLTNWIPSLGELFDDGKHLVTYRTLDEMVEKAKYYLEHDEEREKIAKAGYEEFIKKHTYKHRVEKILEIVK